MVGGGCPSYPNTFLLDHNAVRRARDLVTRWHPAFDRIGGHGAGEHHDVGRHHPTPPFASDRSIARRHAA
jgi:hypothetical protein